MFLSQCINEYLHTADYQFGLKGGNLLKVLLAETRYGCKTIVLRVRVAFFGREVGGGEETPLRHGHKESYTDLNMNLLTSEWDSNPRPHEY